MFVWTPLCQTFLEDTAVATLHLLSLQICGENLNTEMWQATLSQLFNVDHKNFNMTYQIYLALIPVSINS